MCTVVIVSSLKGRAHGKARLKLWHLERPRFWLVRNQIGSIPVIWTWGSKCLVLKSHYEDVIMVSLFSPYFSCTCPHGRMWVYGREDATPLTFDNRVLKQRSRRRQRERQKSNWFNFARASRFFVHFFAVTARLRLLPIDISQIRFTDFLLIYRLKNRSRFLSIDYSGLNKCYIFTSHSFIRELKQQRRRRLRKLHLRSEVAMR